VSIWEARGAGVGVGASTTGAGASCIGGRGVGCLVSCSGAGCSRAGADAGAQAISLATSAVVEAYECQLCVRWKSWVSGTGVAVGGGGTIATTSP
jgi:hypothetical protein